PKVLAFLSALGIAAMAWVGGGIVVHGLEGAGPLAALPHAIEQIAHAAEVALAPAGPLVHWLVHAGLSGLFGLLLGGLIATAAHLLARRKPAHG
ncbi:MAG: DUF808 family protein, partial [Sphingomonadaceae bacterium]